MDSVVRVTFNGNIRVTDCHDCCMRWFVTLNGEECANPAPIEAVVYSTDAERVNIHRAATLTGNHVRTTFNSRNFSTVDPMTKILLKA